MGYEDQNDMEDTSGYEKTGVWLAWFDVEDLVSEILPRDQKLYLPYRDW